MTSGSDGDATESELGAGAEGTCILARNAVERSEIAPARNGRSRAKRGANIVSAAMRTVTGGSREQAEGGSGERGGPSRTYLSAGHVARPAIYRPGGLRKGEAASATGRHRLPSSRRKAP
ncbi:hypothetical protein ACFQH2_18805 [Natronoarchaeum sp. GCM10025703]|uniref:hypothetical protein n=1 Tax=Natronoarchaeum sp. GCM10025703 TaxID=3252685 RepID=UPI0036170B59